MQPNAIFLFVLIAGFVWGGFALILATAIRKEGRKTRGEGASPPAGE